MHTTAARASLGGLRGARKGGKTAPYIMANTPIYDPGVRRPVRKLKTNVRLTPAQLAEVELVAYLWTGLDRSLDENAREWTTPAVIERFVGVALNGFWEQGGGRPAPGESRADLAKRVSSELKRNEKLGACPTCSGTGRGPRK
jgi:hypothetical protein